MTKSEQVDQRVAAILSDERLERWTGENGPVYVDRDNATVSGHPRRYMVCYVDWGTGMLHVQFARGPSKLQELINGLLFADDPDESDQTLTSKGAEVNRSQFVLREDVGILGVYDLFCATYTRTIWYGVGVNCIEPQDEFFGG